MIGRSEDGQHARSGITSDFVFALGGRDDDGRASHVLAAYPLDMRIARGPLSTAALENLQLADLLSTTQRFGASPGVRSIDKPADDPPDAVVVTEHGHSFGIELTSVSVPNVTRQRIAEVRALGRAVEKALLGDIGAFHHLVGRHIKLAEMANDAARPARKVGHKFDEAVNVIVDALREDVGVVDTSPLVNPDGSPMEHVPAERIRAGRIDVGSDYALEVHPGADPHGGPQVVANAQIDIFEDELLAQVQRTVDRKAAKCRGRNVRTLVISMQLPDTTGHVSPGDWFLYSIIRESLVNQTFRLDPPEQFQQVVLHLFGGNAVTLLHTAHGVPVLFDQSYLP